MDYYDALAKKVRRNLLITMTVVTLASCGLAYLLLVATELPPFIILIVAGALAMLMNAIFSATTTKWLLQPLQAIWQAVVHISPTNHGEPAPNIDQLKLGQEMVGSLVNQIYQLASEAAKHTTAAPVLSSEYGFIPSNLPLPLFVLDESETIQFANQAAAEYIGQKTDALIGKNVYMVLDMAFPNKDTLDAWLKESKTTVATASHSWERVRLNVLDNHPTRLFDLAAYYNKDNPNKQSTMLVLFDHTKQYSQDEQAVSFIALSVHELRTPLTMLRGYIEAFQEELEGKLDPQMTDFMQKMAANAQQLTAFVNNILNVARIDDDQMELHLVEEQWPTILESTIEGLKLRAKVRGVQLQTTIAPGLPTVAVDRLSIQEVITNLVDNAVKYSAGAELVEINVHMNQEGQVETTFTDHGQGISAGIMPNLFTKFYRDHRNRAQIGGTGLGLYLCKTIVEAHGGHIWVNSKEKEGSTFGFTLLPYASLAAELKNGDNTDIVRGAHGWIKNHSMYRR